MSSSAASDASSSPKAGSGTRGEPFQALSSHLANTAQVLAAWATALTDPSRAGMRQRLDRAACSIQEAVEALTTEDEAAHAGAARDPDTPDGAGRESETPAPSEAPATVSSTHTDLVEGALGLRGRSEMISLVEFVGFLANLGRDGVLQVQTGTEEFILQIERGDLVFAVGNNPRGVQLGDILVSQGALGPEDVAHAFREGLPHEFIAETVLRLGLADEEAVGQALEQQMLQMFGRMHRVGPGFDFQFEEDTSIPLESRMKLNISFLLLESARLNDQGEVITHGSREQVPEISLVAASEVPNRPDAAARAKAAVRSRATPGSTANNEARAKPKAAKKPRATAKSNGKASAKGKATAKSKATAQGKASAKGKATAKPRATTTPAKAKAPAEPAAPGQTAASDAGTSQSSKVDLRPFRAHIERSIDGDDLALPALPHATAQLLAMCWEDEVDAEQLCECISQDQALSAHLLRVANSAAHSAAESITSLQLAVTRLGVGQIRELALGLALDQKVFRSRGRQELVRDLWLTAATTSGFGGHLGSRCLGSSAQGSLLGLLMDMGKPIILGLIHEVETSKDTHLDDVSIHQLMEEFHERAGSCLAEKWCLPDWLCSVIAHHHHYEQAGDNRVEVMVGYLAYELALWAQDPASQNTLEIGGLPLWTLLGLNQKDLTRLQDERDAIVEMAALSHRPG